MSLLSKCLSRKSIAPSLALLVALALCSTTVEAVAIQDLCNDANLNFDVTSETLYQAHGCSSAVVLTKQTSTSAAEIQNAVITFTGLTYNLAIGNDIVLGQGSSITISGASSNVNSLAISASMRHASSFIKVMGLTHTSLTVADGSLTSGTLRIENVAEDDSATLNTVITSACTDCTIEIVDHTASSLTIGGSHIRSKVAISGTRPSATVLGSLTLGTTGNAFTDGELSVSSVTVKNNAVSGKFPFVNSKVTFTGNDFQKGFGTSSAPMTFQGPTVFRKNKFTADDDDYETFAVTMNGGRIEHDKSNVHQAGNIQISAINTRDDEVAIEGSAQKVGEVQINFYGSINSDIRVREIESTSVSVGLAATTSTKVLTESLRANWVAFTPVGGSDSSNSGAEIKFINNHQVNVVIASGIALDGSTFIIQNNRLVGEQASSIFGNADAAFTNTLVTIANNQFHSFAIDELLAPSSEFKFRDNAFTNTEATVKSLTILARGGKIDHDTTNKYAAGAISINAQSGNGHIFNLDATNIFGHISFADGSSANSDLQFRGISAASLEINVAGSTHGTVIVESLTANSLTISGDTEVASFMTINVFNNDAVGFFSTEALNLRDSKVTLYKNTFKGPDTSVMKSDTFTRSSLIITANSIFSLDINVAKARNSDVTFRYNNFTQPSASSDALLLTVGVGGKIIHDATNTYVAGNVIVTAERSSNDVFILDGTSSHSSVSYNQVEGQNATVVFRGITTNELTVGIKGSLDTNVLVEEVIGEQGATITINGDVDRAAVNANIVVRNNYGSLKLVTDSLHFVDATISVTGNELTYGTSILNAVALKDTTIVFDSNMIDSFSGNVEGSKGTLLRFRRNVILTSINTAFNLVLADGGSIDHDDSNAYSGGAINVESTRGIDNIFSLGGHQHHDGGVSYTEIDGVGARVSLRSFSAAGIEVTFEGTTNADLLIENTNSVNELSIKGGLGRASPSTNIRVLDNVAGSLQTTDLNLVNSAFTFSRNRVTSRDAASRWNAAVISTSCIAFNDNTFYSGLTLADASVAEGSTLTLRRNVFLVSFPDVEAFTVKITANGRIDHDESNVYSGGSIAVTSIGGKNSIFELEGKRIFGAISYTESGVGVNNYVSVRGLTASSISIDLGIAVSSSALVESSVVNGALYATMTKALDSYIAVEKSTLRGTTTLGGLLKANSHYWIRDSASTGAITVSAKTDCREEKPCRVEIEGNKLSSKTEGTSLTFSGAIGDYTTLAIAGNKLGSSATGTAIAFTGPSALTGSASLVIARNAATRYTNLDKAVTFVSAYTFTGFADVWGNVFIAGGIRLRLGASPSNANIVNNRASFFLITGTAVSGGRVSACNTLTGNDQSMQITSAGFTNEACNVGTVVEVCGGSRTQPATEDAFTACNSELTALPVPDFASACSVDGAPVTTTPVTSATPSQASTTAAPTDAPTAAPPAAGGIGHQFLQGASSASVAASVAVVAMVGAMMAL